MDTQPPLSPELRLAGEREQRDWRLSRETCETGRRGIALARQALRDARRRQPGDGGVDGSSATERTAA